MPIMINSGAAPKPRIASDSASPIPDSARKRVSRLAPTAMISKAAVVVSVSVIAMRRALNVSVRYSRATMVDSMAPMAPASVGVNAPPNRPANTPITISSTGHV